MASEISRRRALGIACGAWLVAAAAASPASAFVAPPAPVRMVVVGDSLALGVGATDPANGFTFRLYRALVAKRPGSEVTNHAIGGSRASDVLRLQAPEVDNTADLVVVLVGGNDVVRETGRARFARDIDALLAAVRRRAPRAALVVCGVPDVARSPLFADSKAKTERLARADDAAVRAAAARYRAAFVDLFDVTYRLGGDAEFFSSDDFHPSDAGYARLAEIALPVVERALGG